MALHLKMLVRSYSIIVPNFNFVSQSARFGQNLTPTTPTTSETCWYRNLTRILDMRDLINLILKIMFFTVSHSDATAAVPMPSTSVQIDDISKGNYPAIQTNKLFSCCTCKNEKEEFLNCRMSFECMFSSVLFSATLPQHGHFTCNIIWFVCRITF